MENFRKTVMLRAYQIMGSQGYDWSTSLKSSWQIYRAQKSTIRREQILVLIYNANISQSYNPKKIARKERASRLLDITRQRYGTLPAMRKIDLNTTAESISGNGRFSLD